MTTRSRFWKALEIRAAESLGALAELLNKVRNAKSARERVDESRDASGAFSAL